MRRRRDHWADVEDRLSEEERRLAGVAGGAREIGRGIGSAVGGLGGGILGGVLAAPTVIGAPAGVGLGGAAGAALGGLAGDWVGGVIADGAQDQLDESEARRTEEMYDEELQQEALARFLAM